MFLLDKPDNLVLSADLKRLLTRWRQMLYRTNKNSEWVDLSLENSWTVVSGEPGYRIIAGSLLQFRGVVAGGLLNTTIATLGTDEFLPEYTAKVAVVTEDITNTPLFGSVVINTDGTIVVEAGSLNYVYLHSILIPLR